MKLPLHTTLVYWSNRWRLLPWGLKARLKTATVNEVMSWPKPSANGL